MDKFIEIIQIWWNKSTGFRHAVTTWLSAQLTIPLMQVMAWGASCADNGACNSSLLPNWHTTMVVIGGGAIVALGSGLLKHWQQRRAFPSIQ